MNIGLVCPYEWTVPGGVGNHVRALAGELRRAGHRVDVLAPAERPVAEPGFVGLGGSVAVPYNGSVARIAFGPRALVRMRRAVGRGGSAGRLVPGAACDLVVLAGRSYLDLAYHLGVNLAEVVVKDGTVVAGAGAPAGAGS